MKKMSFTLVMLMIVGSLVGCTPTPKAEQGSIDDSNTAVTPKKEVIRVGTMANNIGAPLYYAYENGLYEEAGLNVEIILFPTGAPINEALAAEQIDIAASGLASVYALASGECTWLGEIDVTLGGMGVYVRPDSPILKDKGLIDGKPEMYGSPDSIKGMTIFGPLGTSAQFNAITWAQSFGLDADEFTMLHMEYAPALQAFKAGEGDAVALNPPFVYEAEALGYINAATLLDTSGITMCNGIVGRTKFTDSRREDVKKFLEITYGVVDEFYENDQLVFDYSLNFYNENGKDYTEDMMWQEIKDRDFYGKTEFTKPDFYFGSTMIGMGDFYVKDGKIEEELAGNIPLSMDPSFLEEIYDIKLQVFEN